MGVTPLTQVLLSQAGGRGTDRGCSEQSGGGGGQGEGQRRGHWWRCSHKHTCPRGPSGESAPERNKRLVLFPLECMAFLAQFSLSVSLDRDTGTNQERPAICKMAADTHTFLRQTMGSSGDCGQRWCFGSGWERLRRNGARRGQICRLLKRSWNLRGFFSPPSPDFQKRVGNELTSKKCINTVQEGQGASAGCIWPSGWRLVSSLETEQELHHASGQ